MGERDERFMREALEEARRAEAEGEVPIGAIVVLGEEIIGRGRNRNVNDNDPTAHAEVVALRQAARLLANYRLTGCALYATVEPCAMCAGAAVLARIERLVYGCDDPKGGGVRSLFRITDDERLNHQMAITSGVLGQECGSLVQGFFQKKR